MAVLTADQVIDPVDVFQSALSDGISFVNKNPDAMITFGIQPSFPSTQLGYIKLAQSYLDDQGRALIGNSDYSKLKVVTCQ